jgi:hypothetical protein
LKPVPTWDNRVVMYFVEPGDREVILLHGSG